MNIREILAVLTDSAAGITILIAFVGGIIKFGQWVTIKQAEEKKRKFETYHGLIKHLVEPEHPEKSMMLDKQIAIVYELRNFPEYFFVTRRILNGLKKIWSKSNHGRLIREIDLTLDYINSNWLNRKFRKD